MTRATFHVIVAAFFSAMLLILAADRVHAEEIGASAAAEISGGSFSEETAPVPDPITPAEETPEEVVVPDEPAPPAEEQTPEETITPAEVIFPLDPGSPAEEPVSAADTPQVIEPSNAGASPVIEVPASWPVSEPVVLVTPSAAEKTVPEKKKVKVTAHYVPSYYYSTGALKTDSPDEKEVTDTADEATETAQTTWNKSSLLIPLSIGIFAATCLLLLILFLFSYHIEKVKFSEDGEEKREVLYRVFLFNLHKGCTLLKGEEDGLTTLQITAPWRKKGAKLLYRADPLDGESSEYLSKKEAEIIREEFGFEPFPCCFVPAMA